MKAHFVYFVVIIATLGSRPERVLATTPCDQQTDVCVSSVDQSLTFPEIPRTETEMTLDTTAQFGSLNAYLKGIVAGFFDFVFPGGIPWGKVGEILQNFAGNNPDSTEGKGDVGYLGQQFSKLGSTLTVLFLIGVPGVLFLLFFPTVACCMCCCRCCCNNCGGKRIQNNPTNCCFLALLIGTSVTVTFILIGGSLLCATHVQFTKDVPSKTFDMTSNTASIATTWIKNILNDMFNAAAIPFNGTIDVMIDDLGTAGIQIWAPLQADIETDLGTPATNLDAAIAEYNTNAGNMNTYYENTFYGQSMEPQNMRQISEELERIRASLAADGPCSGDGAQCADSIDELANHVINHGAFAATVGYTDPPIANGFNQSSLFGDIVTRAGADVADSIQNQADELRILMDQERNELLTSLREAKDGLVDSIEGSGLDDIDLTSLKKNTDKFTFARDIISAVMFFPTVFVFLFAAVGIGLGLLGYDKFAEPHERSRISNIGGNLVCCSSVLSFLFVWFYMLWFIMPFLLLAFPQRICTDVQSDKLTKEILDRPYMFDKNNKYYFANIVLGDGNIELTFTGILNDCSLGKTFWQAFKMADSEKYDISGNLNSDAIIGDTSTLFSDSATFSFNSFQLLDGDFESDISDITTNVGTYETGIDTFKTTMENTVGVYETQLTTTQAATPTALASTLCATNTACDSLEDIRDAITASGITSTAVIQALTDLQTVINNVAQMGSDYDDFVTAADDSRASLATVSTAATALNFSVATVETDLQTNGAAKLVNSSDSYARKLKGWLDDMFQFIEKSYEENVGECETFSALYRAFFANTCDYFLLEISGLYFSSGIIAISMFGNLIWATKLAKYLRKMADPNEPEDDGYFETETERFDSAQSNLPRDTPPPFSVGFIGASAAVSASGATWDTKKSWEP